MMKSVKTTYKEDIVNLHHAIDIALQVYQEFPPPDTDLLWKVNVLLERKQELYNLEPRFQNKTSVSYLTEDFFIYFQESSGITVDKFWEKIKESNLPYKRVNRIAKILTRGKIKNDIEYQFIIDVMLPYLTEGVITEEEYGQINDMIAAFENRMKR